MRYSGTLILAVLSLIVWSVYFFYLLPVSVEKKLMEEIASRFFRIDVRQVEFLRIQNPKGSFDVVREEREGRGWKVKSPDDLPADSAAIQKLMDIISKGKIIKIITEETKKMAQFGLDKPRAILYIGYEGRIDELGLGGINPARTGIYAYAKGIDTIFLVNKEVEELINVGLYELRSKALISFDPDIVNKINIISKKGEIELINSQKGWEMVMPIAGRADDEAIRSYMIEVLNQRADEFFDNSVPDAESYRDSIRILLYSNPHSFSKGGITGLSVIDVHFQGTGAGEGVVVHQKGMKYSGRLQRDFWNVVNRDASYFSYRNLYDFDEKEIWGIRVKKDATEYELVRKRDRWLIDNNPVDSKKVMEFIWFLKAWKAEMLVGTSTAIGRDKAIIEIGLENKTGALIGTTRVYGKIEGSILGFNDKEKNELYYAASDNLKGYYAVSSLSIKQVPEKKDFSR